MIDDHEIDDFLEHVGVKGMRWGHRKPRDESARAKQFGGKKPKRSRFEEAPRGDFMSRSFGEQAALVAGGYASLRLGEVATRSILRSRMPIAQIFLQGTAVVMGVRLTRSILDRNKDVQLSDIAEP